MTSKLEVVKSDGYLSRITGFNSRCAEDVMTAKSPQPLDGPKFLLKSSTKLSRFYHVRPISSDASQLCDITQKLRIPLKTNWRKRVRVEVAHKRNFNYMQTADDIKKQ